MYIVTSNGEELTLNIFKSGNIFPMTWALGQIPNEYFFETMTESRVYRSPAEDFFQFIKDNNKILLELTTSLVQRLDRLHKRIQYLTLGDSSIKVINVFLMLARRMGEENKFGLIINTPITHHDIANFAGITRETVGLEIKKLKQIGLITMKGRLYVLKNIDKLQTKSEVNQVVDNGLVPGF